MQLANDNTDQRSPRIERIKEIVDAMCDLALALDNKQPSDLSEARWGMDSENDLLYMLDAIEMYLALTKAKVQNYRSVNHV